jgi:hypothetical protein
MNSMRKTALIAGIFYLITFVSIPTLALYGPVHDADYITGHGSNNAVITGGILELIVGLAGIGTAIALYPVVKRQSEWRALGFVGARVLEAAGIFAGVASILTIVSLRHDGVGPDALVTGQALIGFYDSMFLVSQGFIPAINALLLGSLLYQSRLVPRALPLLGFVGAVLLVTSGGATLFGLWDRVSTMAALSAMPIAVWEFGLGLWLTFKGFNASPLTSESANSERNESGRVRVALS